MRERMGQVGQPLLTSIEQGVGRWVVTCILAFCSGCNALTLFRNMYNMYLVCVTVVLPKCVVKSSPRSSFAHYNPTIPIERDPGAYYTTYVRHTVAYIPWWSWINYVMSVIYSLFNEHILIIIFIVYACPFVSVPMAETVRAIQYAPGSLSMGIVGL
jgi:hypothetical protein